MTWNSKDVFAEADLETLSSAALVIKLYHLAANESTQKANLCRQPGLILEFPFSLEAGLATLG